MKKHLLFLGPPGAGKGTQAALLSEANSYLHLSTGELLRKEIALDTDLGRQVKDIMNKGELVNDQIVLEVVKKNLYKDNKGWILDGYPRNLSQVNSLNNVLLNKNQPLEIRIGNPIHPKTFSNDSKNSLAKYVKSQVHALLE